MLYAKSQGLITQDVRILYASHLKQLLDYSRSEEIMRTIRASRFTSIGFVGGEPCTVQLEPTYSLQSEKGEER